MRGWPQAVALDNASGSAGLNYVFPGAVLVKLTSLAFKLTTAAGGGARQVIARLEDGTNVTAFAVAAPGTQAGGLTVTYSFAPLLTAGGSSALGFQQAPFVGGWLPENLTLLVGVTAAAAGDLVHDGRMLVSQIPMRELGSELHEAYGG